MGLGDTFKSLVLTEYKADTKQMRKELRKLSGEQKKQAREAIEAAEKQNDAIDSQIAMLGKAAGAIAAVTGAYMAAKAGMEEYEKRSRLLAATVGLDLKSLQRETKGLISETRLLEFSSKAMNGTWRLSQKEMEQALKGAVALRKTLGVDLNHALERMQQAITEGTTEPLKELGLVVKGVENDTREGLNAALKELAEQARLAGPDMALPGDEMARSQVKMKDAVDKLKISLGELAQALAPVIAKLAEMVGLVAQASEIAFGDRPSLWSQAKEMARGKSLGDTAPTLLDEYNKREDYYRLKQAGKLVGGAFADAARNYKPPKPTGKSGRRGGSSGGGFTLSGAAIIEDGLGGESTGGAMYRDALYKEAMSFRGKTAAAAKGSGSASEIALANMRALNEEAARLRDLAQSQKSGLLAGIFGTPAEIDATAEALSALTAGFDGLAGAFGSGVDALITGSDSFANAFKKAIGESLRSMAVDMSIRALRETAMAIAELAVGNVASASLHGKAAAAYGAGALAAGVAARQLGAGAQGAQAPKTAGSAGVGASFGGGGAANDNGKTSVFIVGNDFAGMNARQREAMWRQTSRAAGVQIDGDVIVNG